MNESDLIYAIQECKKNLQQLEKKLVLMQVEKRKKASDSYLKIKQKRQENGKKLPDVLNVGDFVKVTGTRSRNKVRRIISKGIETFAGLHSDSTMIPKITEHGYSKVTEVLVETQWMKVEDFIEDESWNKVS